MTSFIPDLKIEQVSIPYYEDSPDRKIPGRATTKSTSRLQSEISQLLTKLGAFNVAFMPGIFPGKTKRYGFQVTFQYGTALGRLDCAALPIRSETPAKKEAAIKQALFLLRNKMEAMVYASIYEPNGLPLVPYLIGAGNKTVTEALIESGNLPLLAASNGNGK